MTVYFWVGPGEKEQGRVAPDVFNPCPRMKKKATTNYLRDAIIRRYISITRRSIPRSGFMGFRSQWGGPYRSILACLWRLFVLLLHFASVAYGRKMSGHTSGISGLHLRGPCVFLRYPQNRRLGMIFIRGVPARQDLQRRRRLWEGDSTTDAFVTTWGDIIERVALWLGCQQKILHDGKRHAERRYDLYYYTMLCIYPPMAEHFCSPRQRRRRMIKKLTLATAL